ncbi:helix-turn-helix domain-containing protein [Croceivirga thetidis]|uniref:AraC family transcriptional regulator n=1 Tax=Croceivirga thetidis TaxID=2721623 RepID=A0ABX1GMA5_9FLAO|nr:helix-turn-helix domain-containing protein [Croceivirga thetidis]NKI31052.1 AraC family transcriptional regulator [Croceivirga thetidis]
MTFFLFQGFPEFNSYSTPLLILGLQGLLLAILLYRRFLNKRLLPDIFLAAILLIMCYHRTTYTIGFMGWYDTFRNTKINYYLVAMDLLMAPLLFFYVKSILNPKFKLLRKHIWHAMPWILFFLTKLFILIYDSQQPGFDENQNGYLVVNFQWPYLNTIVSIFSSAQMLLYLAFSFQLYFQYKKEIKQFFSNTTKKELNWVLTFLLLYSFIFLYGIVQVFIDSFVFEMSWTQKWWIQFFSALVLLYFGVKGYFTDFSFLKDFHPTENQNEKSNLKELKGGFDDKKAEISALFQKEQLYLDPELNLAQLSKRMSLNRIEVSELINNGFGKNFNDFVNHYRIEQFKERLKKGDHQQMSLVGIAFDCGFNSKATFNRVFKKVVQLTPTQYLESLS